MSGFLRGFFSLGTLALGTMTEVALVTAGKAVELAMLNQTNEAHAIIAALLQQNSETNPGFPITRCIPSVMQFSYEIAEDLPPEIEAAKFDEQGMERLEEGSLQHVAYWLEGVNIGKDATEQDFAKLNSLIKEWESRIDNWSRGERVSAGLAGLLSIALHLNKTDEADDIMSRIASRIHETRQSEYISHIRPAWRIYFQSGWLRDRLGLTKDELKQYGEFVFNSTKKRLEEGRAKPSDEYKDKSFKDMLEELDQNTLRFPEEYENMLYEENMLDDDDDGGETRGEKKERFSEYQQYIAPPTILRKPATAAQIAEVESKLGHSLPQDLKDFYALTNGTRLAISGPGLYMLIDYFPKVENIHWDTEVANLYNFELLPWGELPVRVEWPTIEAAIAMHPDRGEWNYAWYLEGELIVKARNALEAAYQKAGEVEKIILDKMVKDYHGSWAQLRDLQSCWYTAMGEVPEGTAVFPTFRDYLSLVVFESRYEEDKSPLKLPEGVFL